MNIFILLFLFFSTSTQPLNINIICPANKKGLEVDGNVLSNSLTSLGCKVHWHKSHTMKKIPFADVNIFCEQIHPEAFSKAHLNWFIPNPECYSQPLNLLDKVDLILCRTKEVERIFDTLGKAHYFLGFTTPDIYNPKIQKDDQSFIHVAGGSPYKGTLPLFTAWQNNPHYPHLTVVSTLISPASLPTNLTWVNTRLPTRVLRYKQNQSAIHLCLSETEGFGHYLMEAMATGAIVITTNAPPMNEFITDPRFLVSYDTIIKQNLGDKYLVTSSSIEATLGTILTLSPEELSAIGAQNRARYLEKNLEFQINLKTLITQTTQYLK